MGCLKKKLGRTLLFVKRTVHEPLKAICPWKFLSISIKVHAEVLCTRRALQHTTTFQLQRFEAQGEGKVGLNDLYFVLTPLFLVTCYATCSNCINIMYIYILLYTIYIYTLDIYTLYICINLRVESLITKVISLLLSTLSHPVASQTPNDCLSNMDADSFTHGYDCWVGKCRKHTV